MAGIAGKVQRHTSSLDPSGKSKYVSTAFGLDLTELKEGEGMQHSCLRRLSGSAVALLLMLPLSLQAQAGKQDGKKTDSLKPVTHERLLKGTDDPAAWLMYGGNYQSWRFSPLKDLNRQNIKKLQVAWIFQTGIPGQLEASPVVADGILYLTTSYNHLFALDAIG